MRHDWPGNVRELENLIERCVVLRGSGEITARDLPPELAGTGASPAAAAPGGEPPRPAQTGAAFHEVVDRFEAELILRALEQTHWNKNQAARLLGLNRTTLLEKIKKKGLAPDA
jgi:DNA-binding NtrC family response regulator